MATRRHKGTVSNHKALSVPLTNSSGTELHNINPQLQTSLTDQGNPKDKTRTQIANLYVRAFLIIICATLIYMLLYSYSINDIKDVLLAESGILSGPLGFIIGFYFKEESERKQYL